MPLELIALAALIASSALVTVVTLHNSQSAETVEARSARTNGVVIDSGDSHVIVRFTWNGTETTAKAPVQSGGGYQRDLRYPILVDTREPTSIRMAMEPYNAAGPIIWMWLITAAAVVPVGNRLLQRRYARRRIRTGPWLTMFVTTPRTTPRFAVAQLKTAGDRPGTHRGLVLLPQIEPWRELSCAREVIVCGTLNTLDSPVLIVGDRAHVAASRLYFGNPLLSWIPKKYRSRPAFELGDAA
jgi:hypothetical protein